MNGFPVCPLSSGAPGEVLVSGSFQCNGAAAPVALRSSRGIQFTVGYTATGLYTVTLAAALGRLAQAPLAIIVTPECTDLTNHFALMVVGGNALAAPGRNFQIQAHRAGVAYEPVAAATARINFLIHAAENTGR